MSKALAECSLAELVKDPLVGLVMKSDGVDPGSLALLFARVARERAQDTHTARFQASDEEPNRWASC